MRHFDIAVIGAGSGGLVAAHTARRRGLHVALLEKHKIGGECTHTGCIPSKTLISSARLYHALRQTEQHGLPKLDLLPKASFAQVMEHVDAVVQGVYQNETPERLWQLGIDVYLHSGGAHFNSEHEIEIGGETLQADSIVVCTGSSPRTAPCADGERFRGLTNENFWELRQQPRSILFLGGGIISVELGQCLARFGTQVTIIERTARIINVADEEISALAAEALRHEGIRILTESEVRQCHRTADGQITVTIDQVGKTQEVQAEQAFIALGRAPNVAGLHLERAGVLYSDRGIETNQFLQTSAPNIYACGDVTSPAKFSHIAYYQAEICMENILTGNRRINDLSVVPWAIFMEPEVAHVGFTEAEARQKHGRVIVSRINCDSIDRFVTEGETFGLVKLVMTENEVIVGADAIGAHAGEWIQFFTLAIKQGLSLQKVSETIFVYPTFSEIAKKAVTRYLRAKQSPSAASSL